MNACVFVLPLIGFFAAGFAGAARAEDPSRWNHAIDFQNPPERNFPPWTLGGTGSAKTENGKLRLRSDLEGGIAYSLAGEIGSDIWDGSRPSTVRFRVRVITSEPGDIAAHVGIRAENRSFLIPIRDREEQTYHFLFTEEGNGRLFIDGKEQGEIKPRPIASGKDTNSIIFGDLGGSSGGETEWSALEWTNEGAFEP